MSVHAADSIFRWNKNDSLDTTLKVVENKVGENQIFLEADMTKAGGYDLVYYLENSRRTTVHFDQQYDQLKISYKIEEMNATTSAAVNVTQSEIDKSFLEMDYSATVPDWKYMSNKKVNPISGALEYTVLKNASSQSGVAFDINGKKVVIKWNFLTNELFYLFEGYSPGTILPVTYSTSTAQQEIKILKNLENFQVRPTHLQSSTDGLSNVETTPIPIPGEDMPGSKPGLEITFQQPMELDMDDWIYKYSDTDDFSTLTGIVGIKDIASNNYIDFNFNLNNGDGTAPQSIRELEGAANSGISYIYDQAKHQYKVNIVQNKEILAPVPELSNKIIEWKALAPSRIYNVTIDIQLDQDPLNTKFKDYNFGTFLPISKFAYTNMAFTINRANRTEANLELVPYSVGSQEEVEYTILYSKVIKSVLHPDDDLWVRHYYSDQRADEKIFIPVPFNNDSSQDVYQILVDFAGTKMVSQVLNYRAKSDLNVPPTTPKIEAIDKVSIIPPKIDAGTVMQLPTKAEFDLVWSAPDNRNTKELDEIFQGPEDRLYYEVLVNDLPSDWGANQFEVIKVFEIFKEGGLYKIKNHDGVAGPETGATGSNNYLHGYNSLDQLFRMENISIYESDENDENGSWTPIINTEIITDPLDVNKKIYKVTETLTPHGFEFPGINYVRIKAITQVNGKITESYMSLPMSLSLSMKKYDIPIAGGLAYLPKLGATATDPIGITLDWHSIDIREYEEYMLEPLDKEVDQLFYGIYISQSNSAISGLRPKNPGGDPLVTTDDYINWADSISPIADLRSNRVLYMDIPAPSDADMNGVTILSEDILGLDKNTNYYIRIVTKVDVLNGNDSHESPYRMSEPSSILSVTTPVIPDPPNEGDIKPLSIENFRVEPLDETQIGAKLSWTYPREVIFAQGQYAFEVISIEDRTLPDEVNSTTMMLEDLRVNPILAKDQLELWRIIVEDNGKAVLKKFNKITGQFENQDPSLLPPSEEDNGITMIDGTNTPNKVYYYYARTIKVMGQPYVGSPWQKVSFTTAPVKGPKNLVISYDSSFSYNPKTESIIRFDAPIPPNSDLNNEYVMEIYIKGEEDEDYTNTKYPVVLLPREEVGTDGSTRLYYKVTGLKPGKAYSIKVRIEDRTKPMETIKDDVQVYPKSPFSERLIVRTEFDQAQYDKEIMYQQFLDYYDQKVKDLTQGPYFVLEKTDTKSVVKYRNLYAIGELQAQAGGSYNVFVEDVKTNIIYLPADFVEAVNNNKITLKVEMMNQNLSIRPFSLGANLTKAIKDQITEIQRYETAAKDYYVKITLESSIYSGTIESKAPASSLVNLKVEVVGSKLLDNFIEEQMVKELDTIIAWKRTSLRSELAAELDKVMDDKKMLKIAQNAVAVVKTNFNFSNNGVLIKNLLTTTKPVTALEKNAILSISPTNMATTLQAYKKVGTSWQVQPSSYQSGQYMLEVIEMTSYILLPLELSATALGGKYTLQELEVIGKYQLTDIFNSKELSSSTMNLQKYRMIPAFARLLGATSGSNDQMFLKNQGITIATTNMYSDLSKAEVLYFHTLVFAKKHSISLNNAKILDYNKIQDLDKISQVYRNTLLIGANLSVFELNNGMVLPDQKVTIKEFIAYLTKIDKGVDW